jgi:hypothetical protein
MGSGMDNSPDLSPLARGCPMLRTMDRCNRSRGFALLRTGAALVAASALLGLAAGTRCHGSAASSRQAVPCARLFATNELPGGTLLADGDAAWTAGKLDSADSLYRRAWNEAGLRTDAAASLARLHRDANFRLACDESAIAEARAALNPSFLRYETAHFVILSDCTPDWSRTRGELLEETRRAFFRVVEKMGLPAYPHARKLVCILFNDHAQYRAFSRANDGLAAGWVAGYYATHSNRVVFYNDATSPMTAEARDRLKSSEDRLRDTRDQAARADRSRETDLAQRLHASADDMDKQIARQRAELGRHAAVCSTAKTIHEAVHLLAFNTGVQLRDRDYPFWLSEGLATSFETENAQNAFGPDRSPGTDIRQEKFRQICQGGKLLPLEELIGLGEVPGWDGETADTMYSLGHALFTFLFRYDPQALGRYVADLSDEPAGPIGRERQIELFTRHFGDLDAIEKRLAKMGRSGF